MDKFDQPIAFAPLGYALQVRPHFNALAEGVARRASLVEGRRRLGGEFCSAAPGVFIVRPYKLRTTGSQQKKQSKGPGACGKVENSRFHWQLSPF
jgi:hypothetical protein